MDNNDGSLGFKVTLDNSQLAIDANKSKNILKGIGDSAVSQGSRLENAFKKASSYAGMMAMGAVASIGMLGREILSTTAKFEKFGIVLKNTLGDTRGADALTMIANFAATTPFQLDEVTGAFIKMANQGFVPTRNEMVKLGDLASSTGKSFDQLGEALLDAQTGQFERLKEFGIKASANGDRVTFSFKEQKTTVENTNKAIQSYILSLGELKGVAGANEKISASLTGQMSNLGDKMAAMYNEIGTANKGILYAAVGGASKLIENYKAVCEAVGVLISIYGVYKVATMAVAYAENLKAVSAARTIAIEVQYQAIMASKNQATLALAGRETILAASKEARVLATQHVIAAEAQLQAVEKKSMLANPYILAAMAVAALGYAIYKVITYQTDLEKATKKAQFEIENEKDKAAQLFAELNHAAEGTDKWKKAKQGILDQYGTYLTEQQKELLGTRNQADAQKIVNDGIKENIALKVQQESLDAISAKYNPGITDAQKGIQSEVKKQLGIDRAAEVGQELAPLIASVKIAIDPEARKKAELELTQYLDRVRKEVWGDKSAFSRSGLISKYNGDLIGALNGWKEDADATNKAFNVQAKKLEESAAKPILTTYQAQINEIKKKKAIAEKELDALKTTHGENPMKAIADKQAEIDEFNKQLGIKEKKEKEGIKSTVEASKEYLDIQNQILAKIKELDAANSAKNTKEGLQLAKEITALEKKRDLLVTGEKIDPLGATVATKILDNQLKPMKQLTEEERKQLELAFDRKKVQQGILAGKKDELAKQRELSQGFFDIADSAGYLAQQIGDSNKGLSDMLRSVGNIAGAMGNLADKGAFSKVTFDADGKQLTGMSKADAYSSAISGATQLAGMFISQAAENKRVMEDYYASVIKQQNDYNLSLNEQMRLNTQINGSIFFNDFKAKISDASKALTDATDKKNKAMAEFYGSEAIVGKKNVVSVGNVLTGVGAGAALGAGIGSIVPVIGTAIGAAAGALIGGVAALFAKKKKDIVAPLLDTYPLLIKANGEFDAGLAKTLIGTENITKETSDILQNIIDWEDAAKAASEQIKSVIVDMTGTIGTDLRNALVDAFENGTDAAVKFGDAVNGVLENILSQTVFNTIFQPALDQLQTDLFASQGLAADGKTPLAAGTPGVDGDLMTPIRQFLTLVPGFTDLFNSTMKATNDETKVSTTSTRGMTDEEKKKEAKLKKQAQIDSDAYTELIKQAQAGTLKGQELINQMIIAQEKTSLSSQALSDFQKSILVTTPGLDLFGGTTADRTGTTKGIAQASQDSVDELNGRMTAVQGHTFRIADGMDILKANSTAILNNVIEIKGHTLSMQADMKSVKAGIDTINLKGITLKN